MKGLKLVDVVKALDAGEEVRVVAVKNVDHQGIRMLQKGGFYVIRCDAAKVEYEFLNVTDTSNYHVTCHFKAETSAKLAEFDSLLRSTFLQYEDQIVQCVVTESIQADLNTLPALEKLEGIQIVYAGRYHTAFEIETRLLPQAFEAVSELTAEELINGKKSIVSLEIDVDFGMYDFYHIN